MKTIPGFVASTATFSRTAEAFDVFKSQRAAFQPNSNNPMVAFANGVETTTFSSMGECSKRQLIPHLSFETICINDFYLFHVACTSSI
jgi:hypothetical protein